MILEIAGLPAVIHLVGALPQNFASRHASLAEC